MQVAIFYSRLRLDVQAYPRWAEQMTALVAEQPGFCHSHSFRNDDGFGVTLSYWHDAAAMSDWAANPQHQEAQAFGRREAYLSYRLEIAELVSVREFTADT